MVPTAAPIRPSERNFELATHDAIHYPGSKERRPQTRSGEQDRNLIPLEKSYNCLSP